MEIGCTAFPGKQQMTKASPALGVQPAPLNKPVVELEWEMDLASRITTASTNKREERGEAAGQTHRTEETATGLIWTTKIREMTRMKEIIQIFIMLTNIKKY